MIDIGGGLPVRYVDPDIYAEFLRSQRPWNITAMAPCRRRSTRTAAASMPPPGLDLFLSAPCTGGSVGKRHGCVRAASRWRSGPGRCLADQAGITPCSG
ncbi:hypothetical protein ACTMU2_11715 [Cupriavidus basilensis]